MTETLNVRWQPGTPGVLLVTSPHGTLEWRPLIFGRPALDSPPSTNCTCAARFR